MKPINLIYFLFGQIYFSYDFFHVLIVTVLVLFYFWIKNNIISSQYLFSNNLILYFLLKISKKFLIELTFKKKKMKNEKMKRKAKLGCLVWILYILFINLYLLLESDSLNS